MSPVLVFALLLAVPVWPLERVANESLVGVLMSAEVVWETRELPYAIRVSRVVRPPGEESGEGLGPRETTYLSVSTFDEYPDEAAYFLPTSRRWQFVGVVSQPASDGKDRFAVLEFESNCDVAQTTGPRNCERWIVRVNPWFAQAEQRERKVP
jgi:hypothetical protein